MSKVKSQPTPCHCEPSHRSRGAAIAFPGLLRRILLAMTFVVLILLLPSAPYLACAQSEPATPAGPASGEGTNLQAPTDQDAKSGVKTDRNLKKIPQSSSADNTIATIPADGLSRVSVVINVTSSENSRPLGDIGIKFVKTQTTKEKNPSLPDSNKITIPDPPPLEGYTVENVAAVEWEVIAQRNRGGYEIYDEKVDISGDKSYFKLDIDLKPLQGTPKVSQSDLNYSSNLNNTLFGNSAFTPYNSYSNQGLNGYNNLFNQTGNQFNTNNQFQFQNQTQNSLQTNFNSQNVFVGSGSVYKIAKNAVGNYFLVNANNQTDSRPLTFIDSGNGTEGVVFMPSGNNNLWFVNKYTRDSSGIISFAYDNFSSTTTSPTAYNRNVNEKITQDYQNFF